MPTTYAYGVLMTVGLLVSALLWSRIGKPKPEMAFIYAAGLLGAMVGAKIGFIAAELPFRLHDPHLMIELLSGRTITGGLLGGYGGVELGKWMIGHRQPTGDIFGIIVPVGLFFGRIGCYLNGCCLGRVCEPAWYTIRDGFGVPRWPATPVEAAFNLAAAVILYFMFARGKLSGQLFHVYLIAYGLFRFFHEFLRDTPRYGGIVSPYQFIAAAMIVFGVWRFRARQHDTPQPTSAEQTAAADPGV